VIDSEISEKVLFNSLSFPVLVDDSLPLAVLLVVSLSNHEQRDLSSPLMLSPSKDELIMPRISGTAHW